jgi:prepilin-type processing-associated H-X9-DG protein
MVGLAFRQWSLDNGDKFPMQVSRTNWGTMEWVGNGPVYFHFLVMSNELNTPKILFCPEESDPKRRVAVTFGPTTGLGPGQIPLTNDNCISYFVGVDAHDSRPSMFLVGDHHFTVGGKTPRPGLLALWTNSPVAWAKPIRPRHNDGGNIALADGSVQSFTDRQFRIALAQTGDSTNRLAMP